MANALTQQPLFLDTDQTVAYKSEPLVLAQNPHPLGVFVEQILINVPSGNATVPGFITVTDGATTPINLLTVGVTQSTQFPLVLNYQTPLQWRNFKITGLVSTGTTMQIWTR